MGQDPSLHEPLGNIQVLRFYAIDQRLTFAGAAASTAFTRPRILRPADPTAPAAPRDRPRHYRAHPSTGSARRRSTARFARVAHRSECRDRATGTTDVRACQVGANGCHQAAIKARSDRIASLIQDGGGAIELFVQRAVPMQHAIENIRGDPSRRETWDLGWQCEFLKGME